MTKVVPQHPPRSHVLTQSAQRVPGRALGWAIMAGTVVLGGITPIFAAEPFVPVVTFPAERATLADGNIDILAMVPGMTPQEIRETLQTLPTIPATLSM